MEISQEVAWKLCEKIKQQEITVEELVGSVFERISKVESKIHAFTESYKDDSLKEAKRLDSLISQGKFNGKLAGLPMAVNDNISVKGYRTACCSKMLDNYYPLYNATVVDKLLSEGCIIVGRANIDEFGVGSSTESSFYGKSYNPWDLSRVPGGSSGGAAASVAADEASFGLAIDGAGDIRGPASFCGVVGIKPTFGRVSRYGMIGSSNSFGQIGTLTKCVKDAALLLSVIAGQDPLDSQCAKENVENYIEDIESGVEKLKIGIPKEYFGENVNKDTVSIVKNGIKLLEKKGAEIREISLPHFKYALATYNIIASAEGSSNLARFDGIRYGYRTQNKEAIENLLKQANENKTSLAPWAADYMITRTEGFGDGVKKSILLGTYVLASGHQEETFLKALKIRTLIKDDFTKAFKDVDIMAGPVMPNSAFKFGEKSASDLEMLMQNILNVSANITGVPALAVPAGFDSNNLPVGLQLIGKHFDEKTILRAGQTLEIEANISNKMPKIGGK